MTEKRMSISLSEETAKLLETLAELQGITQNEAIRRAITTESFIQQEVRNGFRILLQSPDNSNVREVVFR